MHYPVTSGDSYSTAGVGRGNMASGNAYIGRFHFHTTGHLCFPDRLPYGLPGFIDVDNDAFPYSPAGDHPYTEYAQSIVISLVGDNTTNFISPYIYCGKNALF